MRVLVQCDLIDAPRLLFAMPAGKVEAVFDGHACLEGDDAPRLDEIDRRIMLRRAPAFEIRALVRR